MIGILMYQYFDDIVRDKDFTKGLISLLLMGPDFKIFLQERLLFGVFAVAVSLSLYYTYGLLNKLISLLHRVCRDNKSIFVPSPSNIKHATSNEIKPVKSNRPTYLFSTIFNGIKMPFINTSDMKARKAR